MTTDLKYELAMAECDSLRRQLKDAYSKCTAIYEALSILDEHSTKERTLLEKLILDLKQTIKVELEKNMNLYVEKLQIEQKEKYFKRELHDKTQDLNTMMLKYRRLYINKQQEKYIQDNLIIQDDSTSLFIHSQLHSVIASQRATIESLRDSLIRTHVPRNEYDALASELEDSQNNATDLQNQLDISVAHSNDLQNQLDLANTVVNQLQTELDDARAKLTSTYEVLNAACSKIDCERAEFEKSLQHIRRTTVDEIRKNSELYAKTLAMEQTYVAQRQALDTKTNELKQLEKRLSKQEEHATNKINKLAVKLEQEKFISREIVQTGPNNLVKSKNKK
ncbi:unnamed protein product [Rotaria socialis]|uniref:Uncharacterized protein n=1 Tax=Rotaria socialis TaxID=392032 RepID=A0A820J982_9BILA|nr:unnamed protein product [Rotaria socialis]CAF4716193.1 unnamed protein product [Rotaria socialis]